MGTSPLLTAVSPDLLSNETKRVETGMVLLLLLQRIRRTPLFQAAFLGWAQETCQVQTYAGSKLP